MAITVHTCITFPKNEIGMQRRRRVLVYSTMQPCLKYQACARGTRNR
ncbi:MAG TPA: hypothetical protein VEA59_05235 [Patescibacteria group bacterium]|nr:hypothetical protein [Patescibacteria group bacterium]